jgi:hypothetical protein
LQNKEVVYDLLFRAAAQTLLRIAADPKHLGADNAVRRPLSGESDVVNDATHIRIHLCHWDEAPLELQPIVALSAELEHAARSKWNLLEERLREAMSNFLNGRK